MKGGHSDSANSVEYITESDYFESFNPFIPLFGNLSQGNLNITQQKALWRKMFRTVLSIVTSKCPTIRDHRNAH